ncbi:MAG: threonine aldolase family protein [Candidatus Actinomarina sp.]
MIDLRSDTVTKPTKEMLNVIIESEVGDDEYKEDPTVNDLEKYSAELLGFESGLFVTSGTMGNQISLLNHTNPGEEVITTSDSHIKNYEHGAASFLSRIQFRDVKNLDGSLIEDDLNQILENSKIHMPKISLISIENTHLASGGSIVPYDKIKSISSIARERKLKLHIDGARIWHAILEENKGYDYGKYCDSLTFCFSKGLGAPVGSMLLGSNEFIENSREYRKKLGGGMRQVGIIASAAKFALENRKDLLKDHKKTAYIYEKLNENREKLNLIHEIEYKGTNMIFLTFEDSSSSIDFLKSLKRKMLKLD